MSNFSNKLDSTFPESFHKKIHRGQVFAATALANMANGSSVTSLIISGAKPMHLALQISNSHELDFLGYSDTTYSDAGTPLNIINVNFSSTNTPLGTVNGSATITDIGTLRYSQFLPGGQGVMQ